ncbi:MAG: hypothetical protein JRN18_00135 [Nitrososphaerota archaeon]|nr:hypothetical protein [Nitrososphaerota archaeon]MDG6916450.1 hypothetical protein [Nitrososphaerota archaeon]MDG6918835.1 hypothetical protein [Nitrososphaerota archaeon]MDG6946549.1 hypothetical protein [Nitrososphaerota archaeon]MDG6947706.1 hypothetical protein [Nitrososphaerota archaeon]
MKRLLRDKELIMFDLDGVFYKGKESRVKIGGTAAVDVIRSRGKSMFVLTNNSTDTAKTVWNASSSSVSGWTRARSSYPVS